MNALDKIIEKNLPDMTAIEYAIWTLYQSHGRTDESEEAAAELETWNVLHCGVCERNLLPPQVDTYKGETRGKAQENIK